MYIKFIYVTKNQPRRWIEWIARLLKLLEDGSEFPGVFITCSFVKLDENPMFKTRDHELHIKWLAGRMSEPSTCTFICFYFLIQLHFLVVDGTCLVQTEFAKIYLRTPFHWQPATSCPSTCTTTPKKGGVAQYSCGRSAVGAKSEAERNGGTVARLNDGVGTQGSKQMVQLIHMFLGAKSMNDHIF